MREKKKELKNSHFLSITWQNYLLDDSSLNTMSRIWRASCGASARLPARNWPK